MEYNKVAAKWWADRLRNIEVDNFNIGEKNDVGLFAMIFGASFAINKKPSASNINKFEELLAETIKEQVEVRGSLILSCDYHPNYILEDIAQKAGISKDVFPWKTTMWITKDKVTVKARYNLANKKIFPVKIKSAKSAKK